MATVSSPIAFLLGAGASYPYGVPLMSGFYRDFTDHVAKRHPHCSAFLASLDARHAVPRSDLETLITDLQNILSLTTGLETLGYSEAAVTSGVEMARELRGYLDAFIVDRCERFDRDKASTELRPLLALSTDGALWVFSTNYDRIVEFACEANGIAWSDGFDTTAPTPVADWQGAFDKAVRVVKLHGSVNWYEDDPGGALHRLDRGYSLPGHDFRLLRGDQRLRPLMIIPTLEKEALGDPYIGLAVKFTDVLKETRLLIIVGNSLRDRHLKAYIQQRVDQLHVLIVSPGASGSRNVLSHPARTHTLDAGVSEFLSFGGVALRGLRDEIAKSVSDESVAAAIVHFIAQVSEQVADEASISGSEELHSAWVNLGNTSTAVRVAAVNTLGRHPHPAVVRRLKSMLSTDASQHVRAAAIDALLAVSGSAALEAIGEALCTDSSVDVQLEAALALVQPGMAIPAGPWIERRLGASALTPTLRLILTRGKSSAST
jgi:hypothetical protein